MFAHCFLALCLFATLTGASGTPDYSQAARELDVTIERSYAYLDKLPDNTIPQSPVLAAKRKAVSDKRSLLRYAEDRIASLADHHAIAGSSFSDSWAVIPTYTDLWISTRDGHFIVDAVREGSPAMKAGVQVGDIVTAVEGVATATAVMAFWADLGLPTTPRRLDYAARVLAAGRRDRARVLSIRNATGSERTMTLPSLYSLNDSSAPLSIISSGTRTTIRVNNSLGNEAMIAAFDAAMAKVPSNQRLIIDLRDTPSGGNTTVARALMGWFVKRPTGYQIHIRPEEERETGIPRQWIEQVLPREGKFRGKLPTVLVGRWTGSMGEGLAIGFAALGADVEGTKMAGLNGAVEDVQLGDTDVSIKLPTERLMTTGYLPREDFVPTVPR
jgi:C-terminal processing protease CtpA/Prc